VRYCPECRSEFQPGVERCSDCDLPLVDRLPEPKTVDSWAEVFRGGGPQADVVAGALEAAGIETLTPDEYTSNLGLYAPAAVIRVLVPEQDLAAAREILGGLHRIEAEPTEPAANAPAPAVPAAVGLGTLFFRTLCDAIIALALPLGATASISGGTRDGRLFLAFLLMEPSFFSIGVWRRRKLHLAGLRILPVRRESAGAPVALGIGIGLLMWGVSLGYTLLYTAITGERGGRNPFTEYFLASDVFLAGIAIGIAPICEEMFFRGSILGAFAASGRSGWGLLVSSLLFAVLHFSPTATPLHVANGLILGILALNSGSLLAPMIAHAVYNAAIFTRMAWNGTG